MSPLPSYPLSVPLQPMGVKNVKELISPHHLPGVSGSSSGQLTQNRILSEPAGTGCPKIAANTSLSCTIACVRSLVSGCLVRSPAVHFIVRISHSLI